ncbi:MAG: penicillin-binding protein 1C [Bacteroidetes bacterium]|nr:penicillin-binding protein 1C [Bacteroidota bacterium]
MFRRLVFTYKSNKAAIKKTTCWLLIAAFVAFLSWYIFCLPDELFKDSTSTVLLDSDGVMLGAKIADDGQWRFNAGEKVPEKFEVCLLQFEDREFNSHYGISVRGVGRAIVQNFEKGKVVSGGSTLTMQLARIMRKNPPRTFTEKIIEMFLATRMEIRYSKKEILGFYAANAPFGNNVVGLEAASWRYYGRGVQHLSWAESATLAVLPNAPGLIYPGKNHNLLLKKRNRLLKRLLDIEVLDSTTYRLSLSEPLPDKPVRIPQLAPHLLSKLIKEGYKGKTIHSTLDKNLQEKAIQLLQKHYGILKDNKIYNGAVMITSVSTGKVLAYVGNTKSPEAEYSCDVDCNDAPRSTGSILKPFLYAKAMEDGLITPAMLLMDVPSRFGTFSPKNFSSSFDGVIPANKALSRSLNIPMVRLLNDYGLSKFHIDLNNYGFTTFRKPAMYYGLSLILGGGEAKLSELNRAYTQMAQELKFGKAQSILLVQEERKKISSRPITNRACIYQTFEAMVDVNRPDEEGNWRAFSSSQKIAWKTGTSFGFRDAWAIGVTPDFVVSVWMGNADGEGRPGLTGVKAAAPLLFDIFAQLPKSVGWFTQPAQQMSKVSVCHESGHRASSLCETTDEVWMPTTCLSSVACPYHQTIHLSKDGKSRVDSDCESVYNMQHVNWFVLPPFIEKFYKFNHPNYKVLPDYKAECLAKISDRAFVIQYPKPNSTIYVPVEIDGKRGRTIFEATHRNVNTKLFWHLDEDYIGETKEIHQFSLNPSAGKHVLMLVDENGISSSVKFEVE